MVTTRTETSGYLEEFDRFAADRLVGRNSWIAPLRKAAISSFNELGFPSTRHEEWRFTNVSPIAGTAFKRARRDTRIVRREDVRPFLLGDAAGRRLVFVNGYYSPELSTVRPMSTEVQLGTLSNIFGDEPAAVAAAPAPGANRREYDSARLILRGLAMAHLARHADYREHAFTALNTAFLEDGALVYVPKGRIMDEPIHLLFVSVAGPEPTVSHPRVLIVADAHCQATFVESYVGLGDGTYFTNAVTEVVAGENSVVDHYRLVQEDDAAFHVGMTRLLQCRSSNLTSHAITIGGSLVRNDVHVVLDGEGCDCNLNGLFMLHGTEHADNHLLVDHAKAHCNSREFYKGILDGRSRGVFSGRIVVRKGAQKTDAKQTNMNLLLSEGAQIDSKPQLEIFADDVKCTHGATIGQVDDDAIFYLRSRGIGYEAARSLLVYAFAAESIGRIRIEAIQERLRRALFAHLPQGHLLEEAG